MNATLRAGAALLVLIGVACGGGGAGGDGGAGSTGSGGSGGSSGTPGACPTDAPASGAACDGTARCFYEDCAAAGRIVASCSGNAWSVETGPCGSVLCQSMTCQPGQVCVMRVGGALLVDCVENTCGSGAITCGCLQSCAGTCAAGGSLESGVTIQCNTCTSNICA